MPEFEWYSLLVGTLVGWMLCNIACFACVLAGIASAVEGGGQDGG